jgi:hypothetical protein
MALRKSAVRIRLAPFIETSALVALLVIESINLPQQQADAFNCVWQSYASSF